MADYGKLIGAAGDLFSAYGSVVGSQGRAAGLSLQGAGLWGEANAYDEAARMERVNAALAQSIGNIQFGQEQRQAYKVVSGTRADWAGAGFSSGGSGGDILRENAQQGALAGGLIQEQTELNVNSYNMQAEAYTNEANAAEQAAYGAYQQAGMASGGGWMGALGEGISAAASIASFFA